MTPLRIAFAAMLLLGCAKKTPDFVATEGRPARSPSGNYLLAVRMERDSQGTGMFKIDIQDRSGRIAYAIPEAYTARHMTIVLWDGEERVWVYSGDIGTSYYVHEAERWVRYDYEANKVPAPPYLKEMRPQSHQY